MTTSPKVLAKLREGWADIPPEDPAVQPLLAEIDRFLGRWFGLSLADASSFSKVSFGRSPEDWKGGVEATIRTPFDEESGWDWDVSFNGFQIDGIIAMDLSEASQAAFDASMGKRRWVEACEELEGDADLAFHVTLLPDGSVEDRIFTRRSEG